MLIPVYILGFVFGGLILFAIAQRIPNAKVKIWLKMIGILAGPVFFLFVAIFSGWKREKTYDVEWLTGRPAAQYLGYDQPVAGNVFVTNPLTKTREDLVVLKRSFGNNNECYESLASTALAHYLESLPSHNVKVRYEVTYDFFAVRGYHIESIGDFGRAPATQREISIGMLGGGEKVHSNGRESCFPW
jgi:hypothetical protein